MSLSPRRRLVEHGGVATSHASSGDRPAGLPTLLCSSRREGDERSYLLSAACQVYPSRRAPLVLVSHVEHDSRKMFITWVRVVMENCGGICHRCVAFAFPRAFLRSLCSLPLSRSGSRASIYCKIHDDKQQRCRFFPPRANQPQLQPQLQHLYARHPASSEWDTPCKPWYEPNIDEIVTLVR